MNDEVPGLVAVIFDNFGPYHRARLDGAASRMPVCGIELSGTSTDYTWNALPHQSPWEHRILFPGRSCRVVTVAELRPAIYTLLDEIRPAVVAIPGWAEASSQVAAEWCAKRAVPAIVMSETCSYDEVRHPAKEAVKRRLVGLHSAALVGGSAHVDYMRMLGMPVDRIFTGYDAIDIAYFANGAAAARAQRELLRNRFQLPNRYFLASARFIEKKNLFTLVDAYADCQSATASEPWSLVILGDGVLGPSIRAYVQERDLADRVLFPGFQQYPELPAFYGLAGAFVHASTTEQWGLVVNEAMASGLPVLVSDRCGCAPDLVRHGENGFVFDPRDKGQLSEFMGRMASGSCDLASMGAASRRIVSNFGPESFGEGLLKAANRALQVGPQSPGVLTRLLMGGMLYRSARANAAAQHG